MGGGGDGVRGETPFLKTGDYNVSPKWKGLGGCVGDGI
jgi:hypothetical protein